MSLFDGISITGALDVIFGASVTVTPPAGAPWSGTGQFSDNPREVVDDGGRVHVIDTPTVQIRRVDGQPPAALVKDAEVEVAKRPGEVFRVLGVYRDRSTAPDAYAVAHLEVIP